jgi:mono/diheme cytochrome c family protein
MFASHGCQACHKVGGQGGTVGPDLSDEGEKGHSREWLTEQLRDPRAHDSTTVMPTYASLSREELSDLVDYLLSLSGGVIVARPQVETAPATQPQEVASAAQPRKSGAVLWTENCGRCHNYRAPTEFTDAQWAVAVHHMRLRVPLTGQEQRAILKFLQDSN